MGNPIGRLSDCTRCHRPGAETIIGNFQKCVFCDGPAADKLKKLNAEIEAAQNRMMYPAVGTWYSSQNATPTTATLHNWTDYICIKCNCRDSYRVDRVANGQVCDAVDLRASNRLCGGSLMRVP